jgi:hypothetical protein
VPLRDRDSKFTPALDDIWHGLGAEVIRTPVQTPNAKVLVAHCTS